MGKDSLASGTYSSAFGYGSVASAPNAVALGDHSVADQANVVSVGAPGAERRIVNVADGTASTDAANWGQVQAMGVQDRSYADTVGASTLGQARSYTDTQVAGVRSDLATVRTEERRGIAAALALANAVTPSRPGHTTLAVGGGFFRGESGIGVAFAHRFDTRIPVVLQGGFAQGGGHEGAGRLGLAVEF